MKDIKGYEGLYAVTSCGKIWSYRSKKFLKPRKDRKGYLGVMLCKDGTQKSYKIHRLVAKAYLPNPNNLPQVNHKDENKTHNYLNNLEWISGIDNMNYGTRNERTGHSQMNKQGSKALLQYDLQGNFIKEFPSVSEASRELGKSQANISRCANGFKNQAYGFIWKFKE